MHFPIIKIEPLDLPREDWDVDLPEDATLCDNTDYYGDIYSAGDRYVVIRTTWLKELLDGIATIDEDAETITFLDRDTIRETTQSYYKDLTEKLSEMAEDGKMSQYDLWVASRRFRDFYTLFYIDYGMTSLQFVDEAIYYAGQTMQIGNIFDAHF